VGNEHLAQTKTQTFELIERLLNQANSARQHFLADNLLKRRRNCSLLYLRTWC